jgi:uncharacterized protein YuzE
MDNKKISISFDKEADVVYLSFDEPVKAVSEEIEDGVFARYDPQTNELVGMTIMNFSLKFDRYAKEVQAPMQKTAF